jgi:hypothetical protein
LFLGGSGCDGERVPDAEYDLIDGNPLIYIDNSYNYKQFDDPPWLPVDSAPRVPAIVFQPILRHSPDTPMARIEMVPSFKNDQ